MSVHVQHVQPQAMSTGYRQERSLLDTSGIFTTVATSQIQAFKRTLCRSSFASFNRKLSRASAYRFTQPRNVVYSLIPPDRRSNSAQMPQGVGVDHTPPRWEVEQLQTHCQDDPRNNQTRPRCPQTSNLPISHDTESSPQDILDNADRHICGHVVRIVKMHE